LHVHGHCHQKAFGAFDATLALLGTLPDSRVHPIASGCCGMAGAWGYEKAHYDVSIACGERVLLPKVREASLDSLVVSAGFSCRSQIEQATERRALHLAQVIQLARDYGAEGPAGPFPERAAAGKPSASTRRRTTAIAALTATGLAGVAYASRPRRTPKSVWR